MLTFDVLFELQISWLSSEKFFFKKGVLLQRKYFNPIIFCFDRRSSHLLLLILPVPAFSLRNPLQSLIYPFVSGGFGFCSGDPVDVFFSERWG